MHLRGGLSETAEITLGRQAIDRTMNLPSLDALGALLAFVWPGALALQIYRLVMPARHLDWQNVVSQGLFYSVVNYVLLFPAAVFLLDGNNLEQHPIAYWLCLVVVLLVGPVLLPFGYRWAHGWKWLRGRIQAPYPTSWDYFFAKRRPTFIIVHLKNGRMVGGYWGDGSYASAYPETGDLYISHSVAVDERGNFLEVVPGTGGLLVRREDFHFLEFLSPPESTSTTSNSKGHDE